MQNSKTSAKLLMLKSVLAEKQKITLITNFGIISGDSCKEEAIKLSEKCNQLKQSSEDFKNDVFNEDADFIYLKNVELITNNVSYKYESLIVFIDEIKAINY